MDHEIGRDHIAGAADAATAVMPLTGMMANTSGHGLATVRASDIVQTRDRSSKGRIRYGTAY